jgi:hypothetical protein
MYELWTHFENHRTAMTREKMRWRWQEYQAVLEWKLPSYSRLKRNLHEIERNAQRGGELVKRLLKHQELQVGDEMTGSQTCGELTVSDEISTEGLGENPAIPSGAMSSLLRPKPPSYGTSGFDSKKVPHTPV